MFFVLIQTVELHVLKSWIIEYEIKVLTTFSSNSKHIRMLPHTCMIHAGFKELKHSQDMYNSENICIVNFLTREQA